MMNKPPTKRITYLRDLIKEKNILPLVLAGTFVTDLIKVISRVANWHALETHHQHGLVMTAKLSSRVIIVRFSVQIQGKVSKEYRALDNIFEKRGLINLPQDIVSVPTTDRIFNGTGFAISDCEYFKYFYFYSWRLLPRTKKGYYYCAKEYIISVHVTWYFNKNSVPRDFIEEFNRR